MEFGSTVGGSCERVERRSSTFSFMLYFGGQVRVLFLEMVSGLDIHGMIIGCGDWDFDEDADRNGFGDERELNVADTERSVPPVQRSEPVTINLKNDE
jgi:hypothetical protein